MSAKAHGTTANAAQQNLRWNCDWKVADKICSFNRHYAEYAGYWEATNFLNEVDRNVETTYYDSVTGKPAFIAPRGRTFEEFAKESKAHGWPSFRDSEVVWDNVRARRFSFPPKKPHAILPMVSTIEPAILAPSMCAHSLPVYLYTLARRSCYAPPLVWSY